MNKNIPTKICLKCGEDLPMTPEYFWKNGKGGLHSKCIECMRKDRLGNRWKPRLPKLIPKEGYKYCSVCNEELPATTDYFYKTHSQCIECMRKKRLKDKWKPLPPKPKNGYRICKDCEKELPATTEFFRKHKSCKYDLDTKCKDCRRKFQKQFRETQKSKVKEYSLRYRKSDKGRLSAKRNKIKSKYKRKNKGYIEMFPNPFDEDVDWHHIGSSAYVVALPRDLHRLYPGCLESHKEMCMNIAIQVYL